MKNQVYRVLLAICPVLLYQPSFSQCTPAPPAVNICGGGNGAVTNGITLSTGQTYWFSGGPSTFASGLSFDGGTLRVCGNLTINGLFFTGSGQGRIIIESGGSLTVVSGSDITFNGGFSITNRGSFSINHGIHMQNANNRIWNDATTAFLSIAGTLEFNSSSSKFINRGTANIHDILVQGSALAGAVCLEGGAIINLTSLVNNFTGSFAYNGTGAPACVSVSSSAQRNNNVASSSLIDVCAGSGISYTGGGTWGSATVTNNCNTACNILLADELLSLNVSTEAGKNRLQWITADNSPASTVFYIEASPDGSAFHTIGSVHGSAGKSIYNFYDEEQTSTTQYYRIQQITPGGR
ncbi:MAG TPA: hypothetical protein VLD19_03245, partial [Chitinophagaceae bacterium]|nr:hypothetical protein [Chitinophagaceae bacterium]